jgi:hypothetical protein
MQACLEAFCKKTEQAMNCTWDISDELWQRVKPLLPPYPSHTKGGRPLREDRLMLAALLYKLSTGCSWHKLPRELSASTTVYDRFRRWQAEGVFERWRAAGLHECEGLGGLDWEYLTHEKTPADAEKAKQRNCVAVGIEFGKER